MWQRRITTSISIVAVVVGGANDPFDLTLCFSDPFDLFAEFRVELNLCPQPSSCMERRCSLYGVIQRCLDACVLQRVGHSKLKVEGVI